MKKILIIGSFVDKQTGLYILDAFKDVSEQITGIDVRKMVTMLGYEKTQEELFVELDKLPFKPDLILVMKGLELTPESIAKLKFTYPDVTLVNWFFDVYLGKLPIWEEKEFFKVIELYDYFFCNFKGVSDRLTELGLKNVYNLREGCSLPFHNQVIYNYFQEKKYSEEISFIGAIGFHLQHKNRIETLAKVINEGFKLKIWGGMVGDEREIPLEVRHAMMNTMVTNEEHSIISELSSINLGVEGNPECGWGARLYRVMCAGGLYLVNYCKGIEKCFKINKEGEEIKATQDLVIYYDLNDLITKIDFLLENEGIRKKIALNGMKKVQKEHTFSLRVKEMLQKIGDDINAK